MILISRKRTFEFEIARFRHVSRQGPPGVPAPLSAPAAPPEHFYNNDFPLIITIPRAKRAPMLMAGAWRATIGRVPNDFLIVNPNIS
jgi:hypothetical protein